MYLVYRKTPLNKLYKNIFLLWVFGGWPTNFGDIMQG
jgi:hypothetical protein